MAIAALPRQGNFRAWLAVVTDAPGKCASGDRRRVSLGAQQTDGCDYAGCNQVHFLEFQVSSENLPVLPVR